MSVETKEKISAMHDAVTYRPLLSIFIITFSLATALLEGIGVGFILPILEFTQTTSPETRSDGILKVFVRAYAFLGVSFTLEYLLVGVAGIMTIRFGMSFFVGWLRSILGAGYKRHLRERLFNGLVFAPIEYIDDAGSDDLINSFVTETNRANETIYYIVDIIEMSLRVLIYLIIAALLSVQLTLIALIGLGASTILVRFVLEPAYVVGEDVAKANNRLQSLSQAGIQGMRDIRLFNMRSEMISEVQDGLDEMFESNVRLGRNQVALNNINKLANALVVFVIIYSGIRFTVLSFSEIGVFLFAVFRLSPTLSGINNSLYGLNGTLPHLVRVQSRLEEIGTTTRPSERGTASIQSVSQISFADVSFSYNDSKQVLNNISLSVSRGEEVALVGQSGAGKSTIVSLLCRLRRPDSGRIFVDGTAIDEFDIEEWRERLAVVRQNPYIFDETLWENIKIGNREASKSAVKEACEIAQVNDFVAELSDGYQTELGEDGVRLSGGQKQRIAIARALVRDADVLVLDEATSEIDSTIEEQLYDGIRQIERDYAIITIAHRLSTVRDADRIYTIKNGSVVESGTHDELLSNGRTYYYLYNSQK